MNDSAPSASRSPGSFHLFRAFGINVFLHWSWLIIAAIELQYRRDHYRHIFWNILEYLSLFGIVLLHEFGHSLACRSVGGRADRIMLWPLGGVAFVDPPQRPGAVLWSIAAGPLVNVALIPVTIGAILLKGVIIPEPWPDCDRYLQTMAFINGGLLAFNMLPIYPLDGGQVLRSLLWYFIGPIRSLRIAAGIGMVGAVSVVVLALYLRDPWLGVMALFGASMSWRGLTAARAMGTVSRIPRYPNVACPSCREAAPAAPAWRCECGNAFDLFAQRAQCPQCGAGHSQARCPFCGKTEPIGRWFIPMAVPVDETAGLA